jgi:DNA-binding MarR family transcriptional regulator
VSPKTETETETAGAELASDLAAVFIGAQRHCNSDLLDAIAKLELSFSAIKLLLHLSRESHAPTVKHAASLMRISATSASRTIEDLDHRGLVERVDDDHDHRTKRVLLTPTGRETIQRLSTARLAGIEAFLDTLTPSERDALSDAVHELSGRSELNACRPAARPE